ncbi:MAG: efflux RND transporter periplasmic adaptor subunit [Acidobacteria bacterium]|nr:MAG: efflux RND transporter periplasmic adaptor subunit [Acidobacteriota bacterium]
MSRRRLTLIVALFALSGAIYLAASEDEPTTASELGPGPKRVRVATVERAAAERPLRFAGTLRAARRARLAFTLGGRLSRRPVEVGDRVGRGQLLAELDRSELDNAVASARAAVGEIVARRVQAERDRDRVVQLAAARAATEEERERAEAACEALAASEEAARARLREAERRLREAALEAPFAGTVTAVLLEPGEHAVAGRAVVALAGDGPLEVEVEVPESVIQRLRRASAVSVELPALDGVVLDGRVASAARAAPSPGHLFPVVVALDEAGPAAPGMSAEVVVHLVEADLLTVPVEAVVDPGGARPAVFRLAPSSPATVEEVRIEVGALLGDRVVVRGPLAAGDRVVVGGQSGLLDGDPVEVEG